MFCSFEHCIDSNTRTLALQTTPTHAAPTHAHYSFSPTTLSTCSPVSSSSPTVCAHIVAPSVPRDLRPTCWHISARNLERRWVSLHTECFLHSILHSKTKCLYRTDSFFFSVYWAASLSDCLVRGWSGPSLLRRIFAASVNNVFASLFLPVFSYTNPMFTYVLATSTEGRCQYPYGTWPRPVLLAVHPDLDIERPVVII